MNYSGSILTKRALFGKLFNPLVPVWNLAVAASARLAPCISERARLAVSPSTASHLGVRRHLSPRWKLRPCHSSKHEPRNTHPPPPPPSLCVHNVRRDSAGAMNGAGEGGAGVVAATPRVYHGEWGGANSRRAAPACDVDAAAHRSRPGPARTLLRLQKLTAPPEPRRRISPNPRGPFSLQPPLLLPSQIFNCLRNVPPFVVNGERDAADELEDKDMFSGRDYGEGEVQLERMTYFDNRTS